VIELHGRTITGRELVRDEVLRLWEIDRAEVIENVYHLEDRKLVLRPEHYDVQGWPPGEPELYTPILLNCFDRGGWAYGLFDGEMLIAMVMLDTVFIGPHRDLLQLKQLHVSSAYRGLGLGQRLFGMASQKARLLGARGLYISATPSEHTVEFYLRLGSRVTPVPDPELFALEPEDIHLECPVNSER